MKTKIFYLARSYYPYQKGGGPLMRTGAVKYLKELGWDVKVVMPHYLSSELKCDDKVIQIPFQHIQKLSSLLERMGIYEDYLDKWVSTAFEYLKDKIKKEDIVFATSGGELGMIKLASLLKNEVGCKFVVNFRDPLNYGYMNGLRRDKKPHIGRKKAHKKYISDADLILTSSEYYANTLRRLMPEKKNMIHNNYFGYMEPIELASYTKTLSDKLRIAYVGSMAATQKPELLYEVFKKSGIGNIEIYYIGDRSKYKPLQNIDDAGVVFINSLPHDEFLAFMAEHIDIGFVSLVNDYFGACVPSKVYEYINLGLPMLAALPDGDANDIINSKLYGISCKYNDLDSLVKAMINFTDKEFYNKMRKNVLADKDSWDMKLKVQEVDRLLRELI